MHGLYRATIEDVNDPEFRHRYRVRVPFLHGATLPVEALPWAETACAVASANASDAPVHRPSDVVFVMFEGGHRDYPVIVGACFTTRLGILAGSARVAADYPVTRSRWRREDREGNAVELSEDPNELHVLIQSGGASLRLSKSDNGVVLSASDGTVALNAQRILIEAATALLRGEAIKIAADEVTAGIPVGTVEMWGNQRVEIHSPKSIGSESVVRVGQRIEQSAPPRLLQTSLVQLLSEVVEVGALGNEFTPTLVTRIRALQQVLVESQADITITSGNRIQVNSLRDIIVQCAEAQVIASQKVTISALEAISIQAPIVNVTP